MTNPQKWQVVICLAVALLTATAKYKDNEYDKTHLLNQTLKGISYLGIMTNI